MQRPKELLSDKRRMLEDFITERYEEEVIYFPNGFVLGRTEDKHFVLTQVFIDKHFRTLGVYKEYFDYLQTILSFRGMTHIDTEVFMFNEQLIHMLKTLGFSHTYSIHDKYFYSKRIK